MRKIFKWEKDPENTCIDWCWYGSNSSREIISRGNIFNKTDFSIRNKYANLCSGLPIRIMDAYWWENPLRECKLYRIWCDTLWKSIHMSSRDWYRTPSMREWYTSLDFIWWAYRGDERSKQRRKEGMDSTIIYLIERVVIARSSQWSSHSTKSILDRQPRKSVLLGVLHRTVSLESRLSRRSYISSFLARDSFR